MNVKQLKINEKSILIFPVLLLAIFVIFSNTLFAHYSGSIETFETGKIIESVACTKDPTEVYTLYLPSNYSEDQKWPVLLAFDFDGRSVVPTTLFKAAAERYGYIIISSSNAKNGPREPIIKAMTCIWEDINESFSIDKNRIYATGLSGGSRMCSVLDIVIKNPVKGIIAVGAGIANSIDTNHIKDTCYFGICGYADFNYKEMVVLEKILTEQNTPNRFLFYSNVHRWPPEEMCTRAIQWMELMALKENPAAIEAQEDFIASTLLNEVKLAKERQDKGEPFYAVNDYAAIVRTYQGLTAEEELAKLRIIAADLKKTDVYKQFEGRDIIRIVVERNYYKKFKKGFVIIDKENPKKIKLNKLMKNMGYNELLGILKKNKDLYDRSMAERTLYTLINKSRAAAMDYMKAGDNDRALLVWEIAGNTRKHAYFHPDFSINRACAFSRAGEKSKALKALKEAVKNGYKNLDFVNYEKDFDILRKLPAFQKIIHQIETQITTP